jgi:hypothetical protein
MVVFAGGVFMVSKSTLHPSRTSALPELRNYQPFFVLDRRSASHGSEIRRQLLLLVLFLVLSENAGNERENEDEYENEYEGEEGNGPLEPGLTS